MSDAPRIQTPAEGNALHPLSSRPSRTGLSIRDLRSAVRGPFTCDFAPAECTVISGASGSGKSLFLRMVADLDPSTGTVCLDGIDRNAMPAPQWRRRVTYVAAESGWWADRVGTHMPDLAGAKRLFPKLGLATALLDAPVLQLSTGERQRAALVRAILGAPAFLLLDEPTAALDPDSTRLVEYLLQELNETGVGTVIVSHDRDQAARLADRHLRLSASGLEDVSR